MIAQRTMLVLQLAAGLIATGSSYAQTATYQGPNTAGNGNTWMTSGNWNPAGVPTGTTNVIIPANKIAVAWDDAIPVYSGNLSLGANATLQLGWTTVRPASLNALGTAGSTLITLGQGALIKSRTGSSVILPEIQLTGYATVSLGESTQAPTQGVFNHPVTGAHAFTILTNSNGGGIDLNATNGFSSLTIGGLSGRGLSMAPAKANATGSLGIGNVTVNGSSDNNRSPQLQFNAANAMAITSKLVLNGSGPSGNGNDRIQMNVNATIGGLSVGGVEQSPGTYTSSSPWLDGTGTLTVLLISPLFPDPAFGKVVPLGNVNLTWTNETPTTGTDVWSDVWFGTNPASLTQVATKQLNLTSFTVSAPAVSTYYWRVDSYLSGSSTGTPKTGGLYHFVVNDSDGDGMPDAWEQLYTDPSSSTALQPGIDGDTDGLTNLQEFLAGTIPTNPDTDADGLLDGRETKTGVWVSATDTGSDPLDNDSDNDSLNDGWETNTGTWVSTTNTGTDPNNRDSDRDALSDTIETNTGTLVSKTNTGTNPNLPDTDGDGAGDWYEVTASLTNPNLAASTPGIPYPLPDPDTSPGVANKPVKVYIMSGQSNMVGMGTVFGTDEKTLESMTLRQNKFPNLVDATGAWTTRQDVHYRGVVTDVTNAKLSGGALGTVFGPELGFGQIMGWYHDEPVLLLKSSDGNRALSWDVLPPGSPSWVYNGTNNPGYGGFGTWPVGGTPPTSGGWYAGREYDHFFLDEEDRAFPPNTTNNATNTNVVDVLDNFATEYPQYAAQGFEIAGFVWWQGEKDTLNTAWATTYEEHLVSLIAKLREYYTNRYPGKVLPNAPFVLGTLGEASLSITTPESDVAVRDAHLAVDGDAGNYPQFAGNVKTVYTHPLSEGGTGNGHYNERAGTYMLVGDAMGRAMLELQEDESPPTPDPMTFEVAPQGAGSGSIGMKASAASDNSQPVQYYFENTTNGNFRDWSTSREWTNTGLTDGTTHSYRVKARDANGLEGQWSATLSAIAGADATAPIPNPMTFAVPPSALGETSITMTAKTATDLTAVEYFFDCTTGGGPDSGWQSSAVFAPTGLAHSTTFTYTVKARDAALNETAPSASASATTATPDLIPPGPNPMSFAVAPAPMGFTAISMTATTATDPSGVEYRFNNTTLGTDSGWQDSPVYQQTGLTSGTPYTYTVQARDKSPAQNTTTASAPASATTNTPDTTAPSALSFSPANGATSVTVNTNLTIAFDENIKKGTGNIIIRQSGGAAVETIAVSSPNVTVSAATVTIDPANNLVGGQSYYVEIATGAILDLSDNAFPGISGSSGWNFTTLVTTSGPTKTIVYGFETTTTAMNGSNTAQTATVPFSSNDFGSGITAGNYSAASPVGGIQSTGSQMRALKKVDTDTHTFTVTIPPGVTVGFTNLSFNFGRVGGDTAEPVWTVSSNLAGGTFTPNTITGSGTNTQSFNSTLGGNFTGVTDATITFTLTDAAGGNNNSTALYTWIDTVTLTGSVSGGGPGPVDHFAISTIGSPQTVGTPITGVTITAQDASNATITSFTGTVSFGGTGGFTGTSATFTAGVLSGVSVTPTNAGSGLTFTVTNIGTGKTGSATITTIQTQYEAWALGALFAEDANNDGVDNGLAFLLGASGPNANATALLPKVTQNGGNLVLEFECLPAAARGGALLNLQHSSDLSVPNIWASALVPGAIGNSTASNVDFAVTDPGAPGGPLRVVATVQASQAFQGKLFGRIHASR